MRGLFQFPVPLLLTGRHRPRVLLSSQDFLQEGVGQPPAPPMAAFEPVDPEMFHGSAVITSDIPIAVGAFHMLSPEGKFVTASVASPP